jgi:hypothetical protein
MEIQSIKLKQITVLKVFLIQKLVKPFQDL